MIYADNAATTKMSRTAIQAMLPYMDVEYGNPSSLYALGQRAREALESARGRIAVCLGAESRDITFTSGGSEADNQAIISAAHMGAKKGKKHIISTPFEHHAVLHTLDKLRREGFEITLLDVRSNGIVDVSELASAIRDDTCLVTIMYANNEIGTVQPISEIGALCAERGVIFHTDAVQAAGHLHIDVKEQHIDMLSISAHKFCGPKGIGVLYARRGIVLESLINGGGQERGKRAGTENIPAIMGMAAALEEACASIDSSMGRLIPLRDRLIEGLNAIAYSRLNGDAQRRLPGNVNFCFEGIEGEALLLKLDSMGICASSGSACTSGSLDPSHVLLAIGIPHEATHGSLRLTIGDDITEEKIDYIIRSVSEVVAYLRGMSPLWSDLEQGKRQHVFDK